jgi:hypothetical protein
MPPNPRETLQAVGANCENHCPSNSLVVNDSRLGVYMMIKLWRDVWPQSVVDEEQRKYPSTLK